jgi:hypothetical protein
MVARGSVELKGVRRTYDRTKCVVAGLLLCDGGGQAAGNFIREEVGGFEMGVLSFRLLPEDSKSKTPDYNRWTGRAGRQASIKPPLPALVGPTGLSASGPSNAVFPGQSKISIHSICTIMVQSLPRSFVHVPHCGLEGAGLYEFCPTSLKGLGSSLEFGRSQGNQSDHVIAISASTRLHVNRISH